MLIDDKTMFWIGKKMADNKNSSGINSLVRKGEHIARDRPNDVLCQWAVNFHEVYTELF
jgi:hypothetical protein